MARYDLLRLGAHEFEQVVQALLKAEIGADVVIFGDGPDGGRDATYSGPGRLSVNGDIVTGEWVFQCKYHDFERLGAEPARKQVVAELHSELEKITVKYRIPCDFYILVTNVPFTGAHKTGLIDRVRNDIVPKYKRAITQIRVWSYDDVARLLDKHGEVRRAYFGLLTTGDLLYEIFKSITESDRVSEKARLFKSYLAKRFSKEGLIGFGELGRKEDANISLRKVFTDLNVSVIARNDEIFQSVREDQDDPAYIEDGDQSAGRSALAQLIAFPRRHAVVVGGPGQGKSTLLQLLCQVHRAALVGDFSQYEHLGNYAIPRAPRIPFRVIMREYAQWLSDQRRRGKPIGLDVFLAEQISHETGATMAVETLHQVVTTNPCAVLLDGLDEVTNPDLRKAVIEESKAFIAAAEYGLKGDLQVIASTRPGSDFGAFSDATFDVLKINLLEKRHAVAYARRWLEARPEIGALKRAKIECDLEEKYCETEPYSGLLTTPLQVAVFITILAAGGEAPRQREALFAEYVDTIYARESGKATPAGTILHTDKATLLAIHEYLGYLLHRNVEDATEADALMSIAALKKAIVYFLKLTRAWNSDDEVQSWADNCIADARDRLWMLVEPIPGQFGFELRTFQEFFAGCHLANAADTDQLLERFRTIALRSHWRQALLFMAGRVSRLNKNQSRKLIDIVADVLGTGADDYDDAPFRMAVELINEAVFAGDVRHERAIAELLAEAFLRLPDLYAITNVPLALLAEHFVSRLRTAASRAGVADLSDHLAVLVDCGVDVGTVAESLIEDDMKTGVYSASTLAHIAAALGCSLPFIERYFAAELGPGRSGMMYALHRSYSRRLADTLRLCDSLGWTRAVQLEVLADAVLCHFRMPTAEIVRTVGPNVMNWHRAQFAERETHMLIATANAVELERLDVVTDAARRDAAVRYIREPFRYSGWIVGSGLEHHAGRLRRQLLGMLIAPRYTGTEDGAEPWGFTLGRHVVSAILSEIIEALTVGETMWRALYAFDRLSVFRIPHQRSDVGALLARVMRIIGELDFVPVATTASILRILGRVDREEVGLRETMYRLAGANVVFDELAIPIRGLGISTARAAFQCWEDYTTAVPEHRSLIARSVLSVAALGVWPLAGDVVGDPLHADDLIAALEGIDEEAAQVALAIVMLARPSLLTHQAVRSLMSRSSRSRYAFEPLWRIVAGRIGSSLLVDDAHSYARQLRRPAPSVRQRLLQHARRVETPHSLRQVESQLGLPLQD